MRSCVLCPKYRRIFIHRPVERGADNAPPLLMLEALILHGHVGLHERTLQHLEQGAARGVIHGGEAGVREALEVAGYCLAHGVGERVTGHGFHSCRYAGYGCTQSRRMAA